MSVQIFRDERLDVLSGTRGAGADKALREGDFQGKLGSALTDTMLSKSAVLAAPLALSGSSWIDGPSIGVRPGLWVVGFQAQIANSAALAAVQRLCARIVDHTGTEFMTTLSMITADAAGAAVLAASRIISTKVPRTLTLQVRASVGDAALFIVPTCSPLSDGSETATRIWAARMLGGQNG